MAQQSIELAPGESREIVFEVTATTARTYNVTVNGLTGSFSATAAADLIGDLNDDGVINVLDLVLLQRYIAGLSVDTPLSQAEFLRRADVNGDGVVNSLDVPALEALIGVPPPPEEQFYWLRPTGASGWNDSELACDGWTDTYAESSSVSPKSWSQPLEFTITPTEVSAVRIWSRWRSSHSAVIEVFYDGSWYSIYEASLPGYTWAEIDIPGGPQIISKARVTYYNPTRSVSYHFRVSEFEFYGYAEAPPAPPPPPTTTNLSGYVTDGTTGAPIAGASGKVYQDYNTHTADHDFTTDSEGYYLIDNMLDDADQTLMVIYADGYQSYTNEHVSIHEGDNVLNIPMTQE